MSHVFISKVYGGGDGGLRASACGGDGGEAGDGEGGGVEGGDGEAGGAKAPVQQSQSGSSGSRSAPNAQAMQPTKPVTSKALSARGIPESRNEFNRWISDYAPVLIDSIFGQTTMADRQPRHCDRFACPSRIPEHRN